MGSDRATNGLAGVADGAAAIAGTLAGAGIRLENAEGKSVKSESAALAAAMWFAYLNEAARMVDEEYATRDDVDAAMRFGCGYPIGPMRQIDEMGLDRTVAVLEALAEASGDPRHKPAEGLANRVAAGQLGRSTGRGYYRYDPGTGDVIDGVGGGPAVGTDREIGPVGVVGSGTMATGIVEVFARAGHQVIVVARSAEKAGQVVAGLAKSLDRAVVKGRLADQERSDILAAVTPTADRSVLGAVDLVVEAIVEDINPKRELFRSLDQVCGPDAILATTTSSLSVADIAWSTSRPRNVIGMHFFNPAAVMKLVEVVSTADTGSELEEAVVALCRKLGKVPVRCGDRAGFIVNFLLFPYLNDAVRALDDGLVSVELFDAVMKDWQGIPLGPFALLDVVGNDVSLAIERTIYSAFGGRCYQPAAGLEKVVEAGKLGRKTGGGFHTYG